MSVMMRFAIEPLESRCLLSALTPSNAEQLLVELINRGRANPLAEATRYGISLNEGLAAGTISSAAKQPLAINPYLVGAARGHSQWMINNDVFSHAGAAGSDPGDRMSGSGYAFAGSWSWGENIAWSGQSGAAPDVNATVRTLHEDLFVDEGVAGRGHRINLMGSGFREIGPGVATGGFSGYNAVMATEDFAYSGSGAFLTGVIYKDTLAADNFYTPGEGLGSMTITAKRTSDNLSFTTSSFASGGYSLKLNPGTYNITYTGSALGGSASATRNGIVIGSENVKIDITAPDSGGGSADTTRPTASLTAAKLTRGGGTLYQFTVTYSDNVAVDVSDFDNSDLRVTGPKSYSSIGKFMAVDVNSDGKVRKATYQIGAPGGYWESGDNGVYTVTLQSSQVSDTAGNFATGKALGTFSVAAPAISALPTAAATAANITSAGGSTYTFTVRYSDNSGIRVADLNYRDILVTGPNGFSVMATYIKVNVNSDGKPRIATYRFTAPGGVWNNADNGTYKISMRANNVRDLDGNYVAPRQIGSFVVNVA